MSAALDLDAYFRRIDFRGTARADFETLCALHLKHALAIPFENLSTLMGEPVPLDLAALQDKLVGRGRGGYCFEHNALFAAVLEALGFQVTALAARVSFNRDSDAIEPRSHMLLLARLGEDTWLCDVGFGGLTLSGPLRLALDVEQATPHERFRVRPRGATEYELYAELGGGWRPLYYFDLQAQHGVDFEVANHYVATHGNSPFLTTLMAARRTPDGRYGLVNDRFTEYRGGAESEQRRLGSVAELRAVLGDAFGVALPRGAALDAALDAVLARAAAASSEPA